MGYIYKITNKENNKLYIGQTTKEKPRERFSQHRYLATHPDQEKSVSYLHRAMTLEGIDNFEFEVIEEVNNSELNEREKYWILFYNSKTPNGYNLTDGGEGTVGYSRPQTPEEKEKRRESNKQFFINNPEAREKARERAIELWKDEEYRKKLQKIIKNFIKNIQICLKVKIILCTERNILKKLLKKFVNTQLQEKQKQLSQIKILLK